AGSPHIFVSWRQESLSRPQAQHTFPSPCRLNTVLILSKSNGSVVDRLALGSLRPPRKLGLCILGSFHSAMNLWHVSTLIWSASASTARRKSDKGKYPGPRLDSATVRHSSRLVACL